MSAADDALDDLIEAAPDAAKFLIELVEGGTEARNSGPKLAAAVKILELAGVSALEADRRHEELLTAVRSRVSKDAYAEIVCALAAGASEASGRSSDDRH